MEKKAALLRLRYSAPFHDFTFIHRGVNYPVNSLLITAISPVVSKLIFSSNPKNSMELPPIEGPIDDFINLIYGGSVLIDATNCRFFNYLAKFLLIHSLTEQTEELIQKTNTLDNVVRFAEQLISCDLDATQEINLIAGNFLNIIENPYMKLCSANLVEHILKSPVFTYTGVPVINFLTSLIKSDQKKYAKIFPLVFSYATDQSTMYSVLSTPFSLEVNRNEVLTRLKTTNPALPSSTQHILPQPGDFFNGYFKLCAELMNTKIEGPNHHFSLQSSPELVTEKQKCDVYQLLNDSTDAYFNSQGSGDEFITVKLQVGALKLTHYALMSWHDANKGTCPGSWTIDGSSDGETWMEIDRVEGSRVLQAPNAVALFKVKSRCPPLKIIRFRQLDSCQPKNKRLYLCRMELFGTLIDTI